MFFASNDASPLLQAGIIIYRGLYFGLYDTIKPMLLTGAQWAGSEFWSLLVWQGLGLAWFSSLPYHPALLQPIYDLIFCASYLRREVGRNFYKTACQSSSSLLSRFASTQRPC
eukprot:1161338-Pelagomonas_calceolata.AAC.4